MRSSKSVIGIVVLLALLLSACSGNATNSTQNNVAVLCDVEKFANISSAELVGLLGEPDNVEKTTTNGFAEFPCVYYEYNNAKELGEVSFILINDSVVKLVSYHSYAYNGGKTILESFNLTAGDSCAADKKDTYARYRCITDKVDDLWVTNIDSSSDTFDTLQVTYDMFYFEEWYMTMDTAEESDYQWWTKESVNSILKAPSTAKYPNILEWGFWKNPFYVVVESYVDAQNSFGVQMQSTFHFVYKTGTSELVYAVFDNEVIVDNGYVETDMLVSQLIDEGKANGAAELPSAAVPDATDSENATKAPTTDNKETTSNKNEQQTSGHLSTEDMNEFLAEYILPQYVSLNGSLHDAVEYDSGPETEWCYKLVGQVGADSYEAMVYPFQLGKGNEITDLWIAYLKWNGNTVVENDYSEQIDYTPRKYW